MNARIESFPLRGVRLRHIALAAVAQGCPRLQEPGGAFDAAPAKLFADVTRGGRSVHQAIDDALRGPEPDDEPLVGLAAELGLCRLELLAVALAAAVEDDPRVGCMLALAQAPAGGSRPTIGLLSHGLAGAMTAHDAFVPALMTGAAVRSGLLAVLDEGAPVPERAVRVPLPLCLALRGYDGEWPGAVVGVPEAERVALPSSVLERARQHAAALEAGGGRRALVLRSGSPSEARTVAAAIAAALDRRAVFIEADAATGLGPWLWLRRLLPVFCCDVAPSERRRAPDVPAYAGPLLVVCGPDGSIEVPGGAAASWRLEVPAESERRALWRRVLGDGCAPEVVQRLSRDHRHGSGRIAHLGRLAQHQAALAGRAAPDADDIVAAAWTGEGGGLDALAEPLRAPIPDAALVAGPALRASLEQLLLRARLREELPRGLGTSTSTRYRPGVRALFTGPSGTGKTLAAGWIATRLGMPLYRVDLASVTSKYIGETEKNLSALLARAEGSEVMLLFDEADSLFGRRTEINHSNDRFANAQTNYLLQRIEHYEGIVVLTSNSQERFDHAFVRRLDVIIEFPAPGPEERRSLWESHVGPGVALQPAELNRLAMLLDVNGGHIRNAVLAAAVRARGDGREIGFPDLIAGLEAELRKAGRQLPVELQPLR